MTAIDDFSQMVVNCTPLLDVRAPLEFEQGSFPPATNLPLMEDREREQVGKTYKEQGNKAALELGHSLVSGETRGKRLNKWRAFINRNPEAIVYCHRGGQRSQIVQRWLAEAGVEVPRIKGGYKALRAYLINELDNLEGKFSPILLGGYTGSGKTLLLHEIDNMVDLEGLARHRGSAFGSHIEPQPSQASFENSLAYELVGKISAAVSHLVFEDEGRFVGRLYMPKGFLAVISRGGLIVLETPLPERVNITHSEYVVRAQKIYADAFSEAGFDLWAESISSSFGKIKKRLGGQRYSELMKLLSDACTHQQQTGELDKHKCWVELLLRDYYDPMYEYQLTKKENTVLFRGDRVSVLQYLRNL